MRNLTYAALAIALSLTACAGAPSDGDAILIEGYAPEFQAAVAAELGRMPPACQPDDAETPPGCSPVRTLIADYKHLRDRLRAE